MRRLSRTEPMYEDHARILAMVPFGLALANKGLGALVKDVNLRRGLNVHRGAVTHEAVAHGVGASFQTPEQALAA